MIILFFVLIIFITMISIFWRSAWKQSKPDLLNGVEQESISKRNMFFIGFFYHAWIIILLSTSIIFSVWLSGVIDIPNVAYPVIALLVFSLLLALGNKHFQNKLQNRFKDKRLPNRDK